MTELPAQMTCVAISEFGGPEVLRPERRDLPVPGPHQILIKVAAAGVNRPDVVQRMGNYPVPPGASDLPGLEVAGEVVALGEGVTKFKLGDEVMSLVAGGGYAEYCLTHETHAMTKPENFSMIEAGATCETLMTVWHNVFERGALQPGETLLVHGGSSGIGTMAIMMAKAHGAKVIVTVGSEAKVDACLALGADVAINYKTEDFASATKAATNKIGANVILDMVGGDYTNRNLEAAAVDGRLVQIALLNGKESTIDLSRIMTKRLHFTGSTLRPRSVEDKAAMVKAIEARALPWLLDGRVKPLIDSTFPLTDAPNAHRRIEDGEHIGKIVLTL